MPGRTKCPNCGRRYLGPDRVCAFCNPSTEMPAVHLAEPPEPFHLPPKNIFRRSWAPALIWILALTFLLACSTLWLAVAAQAMPAPW